MLMALMLLAACGSSKGGKLSKEEIPKISYEDMPEFVFVFSYTPENPENVGSVTYICKNGDILSLSGKEIEDVTLEERIEKHEKGEYEDQIKKSISADEVLEHYKILLNVIRKKGYGLIIYPDAVPTVEAPRYDWYGGCYSEGELKYVALHRIECLTDFASVDDKVTELYKWIEEVRN